MEKVNKIYKYFSIAIILSAVLSTSGCSLFPNEEEILAPPLIEPARELYETMQVEKKSIENKAECIAYFVPAKKTTLYFYSSGYISNIFIEIGDQVKKNNNTIDDYKDSEISKNKETNDGLKVVEVAEGQLIASLDASNLDFEIKKQEIIVKKLNHICEKLKIDFESQEVKDDYLLEQAVFDLEIETLQLENLKNQLAKLKLFSPVSGILDYVGDFQIGDYINANIPFVKIIDPAIVVLESNDSPSGIFKIGMEVEILVNSKTYKGAVIDIPEIPTKQDYQKAVASGKLTEYNRLMNSISNTVKFDIFNGPENIDLGERAEIKTILAKKDNVISLPKSVIQEYEDRYYVRILKDGISVKRFIELGLESDSEYEIISGLDVGDLVIK